MRRVQQRLDNDTANIDPASNQTPHTHVRTLWFNPWEYEFDEPLLQNLVAVMCAVMPEDVQFSREGSQVIQQALAAARAFGRRRQRPRDEHTPPTPTTTSRPDEHVLQKLDGPDRVSNIQALFRSFVELILHNLPEDSRRLVIFIDDLDKCSPERVLNFLEGCKLLFSSQCPVVMVFALDYEVLTHAITSKYSRRPRFEADRYIEKIFEFSFEVYPLHWDQLGALIRELYTRSNLGQGLSDDVQQQQCQALEAVMLRPGLVLNPRKIKRIFNKFVWFFASAGWLDATERYPIDHGLTWLLVSEYWMRFRRNTSRYGRDMLGELVNRVTGNLLFAHANEAARQSLDTTPDLRSLIDYFRHFVQHVGDVHLAETQQEIRDLVDAFIEIDRTLRAHGI